MSKLALLLRRRSSPLLTPKVTEQVGFCRTELLCIICHPVHCSEAVVLQVTDVVDSDSEDNTEVQPESAYEQLVGILQADMPWGRAAKRMKADTGNENSPANTRSAPGITGKGSKAENRKVGVQSSMQRQATQSAAAARHEGATVNRQRQRKGKQASEPQEDEPVGPSSSMMAHFNRQAIS